MIKNKPGYYKMLVKQHLYRGIIIDEIKSSRGFTRFFVYGIAHEKLEQAKAAVNKKRRVK